MELQVNQEQSCLSAQDADTIIRTAKTYPRNTKQCISDIITLATIDEETASSCIYSKPVAGANVSGASVRLAEIVFACWGNIRSAQRPVGFSEDGKSIIAEAMCWDCEKNTFQASRVQKSILKKDGQRYSQDMIGTTISAAASTAFRNAVFKVIPKVIVDKAYKACVKKVLGKGEVLKKAKDVLQRLEKLGVEKIKILSFFGVASEEEINEEMIVEMIGAGTAIKVGSLSVNDAFLGERMSLALPVTGQHGCKADALASVLN